MLILEEIFNVRLGTFAPQVSGVAFGNSHRVDSLSVVEQDGRGVHNHIPRCCHFVNFAELWDPRVSLISVLIGRPPQWILY